MEKGLATLIGTGMLMLGSSGCSRENNINSISLTESLTEENYVHADEDNKRYFHSDSPHPQAVSQILSNPSFKLLEKLNSGMVFCPVKAKHTPTDSLLIDCNSDGTIDLYAFLNKKEDLYHPRLYGYFTEGYEDIHLFGFDRRPTLRKLGKEEFDTFQNVFEGQHSQ